MTRDKFTNHKSDILKAVFKLVDASTNFSGPSYKQVVLKLNTAGLKTTWGNEWTPPRLCMFLNRMGYVGLHGVKHRDISVRNQ
jgi:hypothetical protein